MARWRGEFVLSAIATVETFGILAAHSQLRIFRRGILGLSTASETQELYSAEISAMRRSPYPLPSPPQPPFSNTRIRLPLTRFVGQQVEITAVDVSKVPWLISPLLSMRAACNGAFPVGSQSRGPTDNPIFSGVAIGETVEAAINAAETRAAWQPYRTW